MTFRFDLTKYLGVWYELMHYPSWFQRNDNYNTMAEYTLTKDDVIIVHNSTVTQGKEFDSYGTAVRYNDNSLRVDFAPQEVDKLTMSQEFTASMKENNSGPNYVIDKIWMNQFGDYIFAVVTDPKRDSLFVLSRFKNPSKLAYDELMQYVVANYDRDRLVQTPHFV